MLKVKINGDWIEDVKYINYLGKNEWEVLAFDDCCGQAKIQDIKWVEDEENKLRHHSYKDIVNHFVKIVGNGTFQVETINESVLIKMLESKGIKIPIKKSFRDIDKDYRLWLEEEGIEVEDEPEEIEELDTPDIFSSAQEGIWDSMQSWDEWASKVTKIVNSLKGK